MEQLNKVELRGRVGITRISKVGDRTVCRFSLATNTINRNQEGVAVEETTWHNCTMWSSRKYPDLSIIQTGFPMELSGRIKVSKYTGNDGVEKYSTEIVARDIAMLPNTEPLRPENLV